jgi:hypothetical protein
MSIDLAHDIWEELKQWVNTVDLDSAADGMVSILVDNDYTPSEIKQTFSSDKNIKLAVKSFESHETHHNNDDNEDDDYEY